MSGPTLPRIAQGGLWVILGVYFAIGAQYAGLTPPWQVPDEPAHYNYIQHIALTGTFPVLHSGDYNQPYLSQLTSEGFPPNLPVDSLRYEGHQPPLYYLLATPTFLATGGGLVALRLFSLVLGAGVIVFAFLIVRGLFDSPALALAAAGLVAFVPQHLAMMAGVNNDSLAEMLVGASLFVALAGPDRRGTTGTRGRAAWTAVSLGPWVLRLEPWALLLGVLLGAAFVTKATAYVAAPATALAVWLRARREGWPADRQARVAAAVLIPALALGALWWGRNLAVYGWPDVLGLEKHDSIITGQPRTADWIAAYGWPEFLRQFAVTTFRSFWGQFGWMGVVMDSRVYWALLAFTLLLLAGAVVVVRGRARLTPAQRDGLAVLTVSGLLTFGLYIYYNVSLVQHQGRYLFTAIIPLAVWGALGMGELAQWVRDARTADRRLLTAEAVRGRWSAVTDWLPLITVALLAALDLLALYRFILPSLPRY